MDLFDRIVGENFKRVQFLAVAVPVLIDLHEKSAQNPAFVQRPGHLVFRSLGVSFAVPDNAQSPTHTSHFLTSGGGVGLVDCP